MADFVQVVVQVDKSQLKSLQTDINKLKGSKIKIEADGSGINAATQNVKKYSAATRWNFWGWSSRNYDSQRDIISTQR